MFVVKSKKQIIAFALVGFLGISAGVIIRFSGAVKTFSPGKKAKVILIDAGHGMPDGGAVGYSGNAEEKINLAIAKKTAEVLGGKGYVTLMTREDNNSLAAGENKTIRKIKVEDMRLRAEMMKKSGADLFLSIHMNSYPNESVNGLRFFYSANHPEIKTLAEDIQKSIGGVTGAKTHAVKTADRDLFLMKKPPIPAILAECGFISNPDEEKKLMNEEYQAKIAWAIGDAVENYYK